MSKPDSVLTEEQIRTLLKKAEDALKHAYIPYSNYPVGAAILTESGRIYTGCNIENSSYGATICAERVAACSAVAAGDLSFRALAVVTDSEEPGPPCGICRQFLSEFADDLPIIMANLKGKIRKGSLRAYLPAAFTGAFIRNREEEKE
ncbi:MAG TPA: cytidine deaminase [Bacillota bacterium]